MHNATAIYSCDDHLDLSAVPPPLWEARLPPGLAGAAVPVSLMATRAGNGYARTESSGAAVCPRTRPR